MRRWIRRAQKGLSLIETTITLGILAVTAGAFGMVVLSTQTSSVEMRDHDMVRAQGVKYLERLVNLPYGTLADPAASGPQVQELFDDNGVNMAAGPPVTLMSLRTPLNDEGWRFKVRGFEVDGVFEIEVNSDLDGNGTYRGIRGTETPSMSGGVAGNGTDVTDLDSENNPNLLRIEIFWNGESLIKTLRAAPVEGT